MNIKYEKKKKVGFVFEFDSKIQEKQLARLYRKTDIESIPVIKTIKLSEKHLRTNKTEIKRIMILI
jgi:hypothetical protein